MIALFIDGRQAVIKKNTSFDIVLENREFEERDAYSLSIELPLADCPKNQEIFGPLLSSQIPIERIRMKATLISGGWTKSGAATIVAVSKNSVSVQFLEGRSAQNFDDTLQDIYINELDLGSYRDRTNPQAVSPLEAWGEVSTSKPFDFVALPWVSDSSGIKYNNAEKVAGKWEWAPEEDATENSKLISWQPSLHYIARKICEAVGYSYDFSAWEKSPKIRLLICNTLPPAYGITDFSSVLPHWSVREFFDNLEPLLQGYFDFDFNRRKITFSAFSPERKKYVSLTMEKILKEFSVDVAPDELTAKYRSLKNLKYEAGNEKLWPLMSCEKGIREWPKNYIETFQDADSMISEMKKYEKTDFSFAFSHRGQRNMLNSLAYCEDLEAYFAIYALDKTRAMITHYDKTFLTWRYTNRLLPVNQFGDLVRNDFEDGDDIDIKFTPVCIQSADSQTMFIKFSELNDSEQWDKQFYDEDDVFDDEPELRQTSVINLLERSETQKQVYFDRISIGFYPGPDFTIFGECHPFPIVDRFIMTGDFDIKKHDIPGFSLRLADIAGEESSVRIDPTKKYKFSFLSREVPDPRDIFIIAGRRYICQKLTLKITDLQVSEIIEGEFYPLES